MTDVDLIRDLFDGVMTKPVEKIGDKIVEAITRQLYKKLPLREGVIIVLNELRKKYHNNLVYLYKLEKGTVLNHNFYPYEQIWIRVGVV